MTESTAVPPAPAPRRSILSLFLGVIVRPRSTFTYLREHGGLSWLWLAGLSIGVAVAALIAVAPITARAAAEQLEAMREQMGDQAADQAIVFAQNPLFITVIPAIVTVIGLAVGWLFRAGVVHLISLLLGGQVKFGAVFRMSVWSTLPDVVRTIVTTIATLAAGQPVQAGLARLVAAPDAAALAMGPTLLSAFLGGIDVYWLWGLALLTIGAAATASFSWRKGLLAALGHWLIVVGLTLGYLAVSLGMAAQFSPTAQ